MPLVYFDSSAFVKLLAEEAGSDLAAGLRDACDAAVASRLAHPEARAALAAAARSHDLGDHELDTAEQAWAGYWAATRPVELTPAVEQHAGQLARMRTQGRRRRPPRGETGAPWQERKNDRSGRPAEPSMAADAGLQTGGWGQANGCCPRLCARQGSDL